MKQTPVNLELQFKQPYIKKLAFLRKFLRYWETTSIYDIDSGQYVQAFIGRKYYYKRSRMSTNTKKLLQLLEIYNSLTKQRMKGVKKAWVYLNYNKSGVPSFNKTIIAENIDSLFEGKEYISVRLTLGTKVTLNNGFFSTSTVQEYPLASDITDINAVTNELINEYRTNFLDGYGCEVQGLKLDGSTTVQISPYERLLGRYIIGSNDVNWEITNVKKIRETVPIKNIRSTFNFAIEEFENEYYYINQTVNKYVLDIKIPLHNFNEITDLVVQIANDAEADHSQPNDGNLIMTRTLLDIPLENYNNDEENDFDVGFAPFVPPSNNSLNSSFWVFDWDGKSWGGWLLRKDVITGDLLTF